MRLKLASLLALSFLYYSQAANAEFLLQGRDSFYFSCDGLGNGVSTQAVAATMTLNNNTQKYKVGTALSGADCLKVVNDAGVIQNALIFGKKSVILNGKTLKDISDAADKIRADLVTSVGGPSSYAGIMIGELQSKLSKSYDDLKFCQSQSVNTKDSTFKDSNVPSGTR